MDKALYEAQLREWPDTVFLSDAQLIERLAQSPRHQHATAQRVHDYRRFYPDALAYTVTDCMGVCFGMRFGVEGSQYLSF